MELSKASRGITFLAFSFLLCFGAALVARNFWYQDALCNADGPFGVPLPSWTLLLAFGLALGFFVLQWWKETKKPYTFLWLFLVAAGLSNALERFLYGCVFDYVHLSVLPLFNTADVVLSISVVFLVWREFRSE